MILPNHLLPIYEKYYDFNFSKASLPTQKTLELFMKEGYYEKHIRKIRSLNKKKHEILKINLKKYLAKTMRLEAQGAGLSILINPTQNFDWDKLKSLSQKNSIKLHFAKDVSGGNWEALRMGFGGLEENEIEDAVKLFSEIWHQCFL